MSELLTHNTIPPISLSSFCAPPTRYTLAGTLMQKRQSCVVATGATVNVVVQIVSVYPLLGSRIVKQTPVLLPIITLYLGMCTNLAIVVAAQAWLMCRGQRRGKAAGGAGKGGEGAGEARVENVGEGKRGEEKEDTGRGGGGVQEKNSSSSSGGNATAVASARTTSAALANAQPPPRRRPGGRALGCCSICSFFWPMLLTQICGSMSRPFINLFVARTTGGHPESLSALAVVYPLSHALYGWINETKSLATAFLRGKRQRSTSGGSTRGEGSKDRGRGGGGERGEKGHGSGSGSGSGSFEGERVVTMSHIRWFSAGCCAVSVTMHCLVTFVAPLRSMILLNVTGVEPAVYAYCFVPLALFIPFPVAVAARAYLQGSAILQHKTFAMAPTGPTRLAMISFMCVVLPLCGVIGSDMGVAALLSGEWMGCDGGTGVRGG